jgi:hypothetical protein
VDGSGRNGLRFLRLPVNGDRTVGTHNGAIDAPGTGVILQLCEAVSFVVQVRRELKTILGACGDAEFTSFADLCFDDNGSSDHGLLSISHATQVADIDPTNVPRGTGKPSRFLRRIAGFCLRIGTIGKVDWLDSRKR